MTKTATKNFDYALISKSIAAGAIIAVAAYLYLYVGGYIEGAFLFSIGLLTVLNLNLKLFTGTVGFTKTSEDIIANAAILVGNIVGCFVLLPLAPSIAPYTFTLIQAKLGATFITTLTRAILCGFLVFTAVYCYNNKKDYMVVASVVGFMLAGGEHCIADIAYFIIAGYWNLNFLSTIILGNIIGAKLAYYIVDTEK